MTLRILSLFGLLALSQAASIDPYFDPRIVNVKDAKVSEFPYQVSLQYGSAHICGGTILNEGYVLTTAHCVDNISPGYMIIRTGANLSHPKSVHEVEKIIIHENCNRFFWKNSDSFRNDIALIKVKNNFTRSDTIGFVTLPSKDYDIHTGDTAVVSGWGKLMEGESNTLQRVNVRIVDQDNCKATYERINVIITSAQLCAKEQIAGTESCIGDSGGPLTVKGVLVGIVSRGNDCANTTFPDVYTRVASYLDWIKNNAV